MSKAYVRAYLKKSIEKKKRWNGIIRKYRKSNLIFVFDTETTIDEKQSLKIGFYQVIDIKEKLLIEQCFFYSKENCTTEEIETLKRYCVKKDYDLLTHIQFIQKFYNFVLFKRALCMGFNLPFDISRIAIDCSFTKGQKFYNGFSFKFNKNPAMPRIKIKSNGSDFALIEFGSSLCNQKSYLHKGRFLDLHTLSVSLSGKKHIGLYESGKIFNANIIKTNADEHGKITYKYIEYLINDVHATFSLYVALLEELKKYNVNKVPEKIYSQASIGKAILSKMGIESFMNQNPLFNKKFLGLAMNSYYGGRSEVFCRKEPMKVTLVDFTSMYPTLNILTGMHEFLVAEKIRVAEATKEIQRMLDGITLESLQNPEIWNLFSAIAIIKPDKDILPIRRRFDPEKQSQNIGICNINSNKELIYSVADLIASKILTGKTPKIDKVYKFIPCGVQKGLKAVDILGLKIDPKQDNIFRELVNERQRIKKKLNTLEVESKDYNHLDSIQKVIKLLINSTCYGIYIESNPEKSKSTINAYGIDSFECEGIYEKDGDYYNPIMAVTITSGSRLFLAIIEALLKRIGKGYAFCDTDSMALPPETAKEIIDFFQPLCPYGEGIKLLKEEEKDVWFYGISAKRYLLYKIYGDQFEIIKHSLHGLGHLKNPFGDKDDWHKDIWQILLKRHYGFITDIDIEEEYGSLKAVSQLTISTYDIWKRTKNINNGKTYNEQIKPFGFVSVGFATQSKDGKIIKPFAPYNNDTQAVARGEFIDGGTGKRYIGIEYWKSISGIIREYIVHPESKFDGDIGFLKRKHVHVSDVVYIGKEVKKVNQQILGLTLVTEYQNRKEIYDRILKLSNKEAEKSGVTRSAVWKIKKKIKDGKRVNLKCSGVRKLLI